MSAKDRWTKLNGLRDGILTRARAASELTLPSLLPEQGKDENSDLPQPYQSLGARGVNNLASKLLLALLPPSVSFFRFAIDGEVKDELGDNSTTIEDALRRRENKVMKWIERSNLRTTLFGALKHLIVTGNAMMFLPKEGLMRMFRLDQYVVVRDPGGKVVEAYIKEEADPRTLPAEVAAICKINLNADGSPTSPADQKNCEIFTSIKLKQGGKMVEWFQEINDIEVPGTRGQSPLSESPYLVMRWSAGTNENYGRGHVEEYIGDLRSLEGLSMAIVGFSAVAAKVIFLVKPNATTNIDDLVVANTGDFVTGALKDIEALQLDKFQDFQVSQSVLQDLVIRLSQAFLLASNTVRDAERVTREEIRLIASELEDVLGGVFSVQSQEVQLPIVNRIISVMERSKQLEPIPKDLGVEATIVTGFEALGRGHELNRVRDMFADITNTFGPEVVQQYTKIADALKTFTTGHNVDIEDLFKTDDEVKQETAERQQAEQQAQLAQNAAGPAAGAAVKGLADQANQQTAQ